MDVTRYDGMDGDDDDCYVNNYVTDFNSYRSAIWDEKVDREWCAVMLNELGRPYAKKLDIFLKNYFGKLDNIKFNSEISSYVKKLENSKLDTEYEEKMFKAFCKFNHLNVETEQDIANAKKVYNMPVEKYLELQNEKVK